MDKEQFKAANIKCQGCATNIKNGLSEIAGVTEVSVDVAEGKVVVSGESLERKLISAKLTELGYPEILGTA